MSLSTSERLSRTLRERLVRSADLTPHLPPDPLFHRSAKARLGDYVTDVAIAAARAMRARPREVAVRLAAALDREPGPGTAVITPRGVVGVTLSRAWLGGELARRVIEDARGSAPAGGRVRIELTGAPGSAAGIRARLAIGALERTFVALGIDVRVGGPAVTTARPAGDGPGEEAGIRVCWESVPVGGPGWAGRDLALRVAPVGGVGGAGDAELERYLLLRRPLDRPGAVDGAGTHPEPVRVAPDANPMYTVQRAHAIAATLVRYAGRGHVPGIVDIESARLDRLEEPPERELAMMVIDRPDVLRAVARTGELPRLARYLESLAARAGEFQTRCRVVTDDAALAVARLVLLHGACRAMADTLTILDVRAPERPQGAA